MYPMLNRVLSPGCQDPVHRFSLAPRPWWRWFVRSRPLFCRGHFVHSSHTKGLQEFLIYFTAPYYPVKSYFYRFPVISGTNNCFNLPPPPIEYKFQSSVPALPDVYLPCSPRWFERLYSYKLCNTFTMTLFFNPNVHRLPIIETEWYNSINVYEMTICLHGVFYIWIWEARCLSRGQVYVWKHGNIFVNDPVELFVCIMGQDWWFVCCFNKVPHSVPA